MNKGKLMLLPHTELLKGNDHSYTEHKQLGNILGKVKLNAKHVKQGVNEIKQEIT